MTSLSSMLPIQLLTATALTPLARYIFEFGMLLRLQPAPVEALASAIARSCTQCAEELSKILAGVPPSDISPHTSSTPVPTAYEEIDSVLRSILPILRLSIISIARLAMDEEMMDHAIFSITRLFNAMLEAFHSMAISRANYVAAYPDKQNGAARHEGGGNRPGTDSTANPNELYSAFTVVLSAIVESLDPNEPSHNSLIEAVASVFLEYVGKTLAVLTFSDLDCPEGDKCQVAKVAALKEAPYLVYTLNKLVTLPCVQSVPESTITAYFQKRLQNTVLRGVFGEKDAEFVDALKRPSIPKVLLTSPESMTVFRPDSPEWFAEKVWSLVGWNLLENSIAQDETLMEADGSNTDEDSLDHISLTESAESASEPPVAVFCYCQAVEHGKMIICNGPSCRFGQFHLECLGLKRRTAGYKNWICGDCRRQNH